MSHPSQVPPEGLDTIRLPFNFLGIDPQRAAVSAARQRSMEDLRRGLQLMDRTFGLSEVVVIGHGSDWEDDTSGRHIGRGAALARLLIEDSVPGFGLDYPGFLGSLVSLEPGEVSSRDPYQSALEGLLRIRHLARLEQGSGVTPEQISQYRQEFTPRVDGLLEVAGFGNTFDAALVGLTGEGLEENTRPTDAKYGAALVALGVGIING